jgi:hypothetical protein
MIGTAVAARSVVAAHREHGDGRRGTVVKIGP